MLSVAYAECCLCWVSHVSFYMLSVINIMLSVIILSVIMLGVIMLSVIMLSVIMLSLIMMSVMAPSESPLHDSTLMVGS